MNKVVSFLEEVNIAAVAAQRRRILSRDFTPAEAQTLAGRSDRSVAAALAVKRAVARLIVELCPGISPAVRDVRLGRARNGALRLVSLKMPQLSNRPLLRRLHISAAHTSRRAFGLAVCAREVS